MLSMQTPAGCLLLLLAGWLAGCVTHVGPTSRSPMLSLQIPAGCLLLLLAGWLAVCDSPAGHTHHEQL
jgi:hypothetical protein